MNKTDTNLLVVPNAGMPENQGGKAIYKMSPDDMAKALKGLSGRISQS